MVSLQMVLLNEEYCFQPPAGKEVWARWCMHAETTRNTDFVLPVNPGRGVSPKHCCWRKQEPSWSGYWVGREMQRGKEMPPFYLAEEVGSIPRVKPRSTLLPHTTSLKQTRKQALSRGLTRMHFHSLSHTLGSQNRIKPCHGMFCFSASGNL